MRPMNGPDPECALDFVPTCRWNDSCELLMVRDGCSTCDFTRNVPRDEDGEFYPPDPLKEMQEPLS